MTGRYLIFLLLLCSRFSFSQKQADYWYFGTLAGLNFTTGTAAVDVNGTLSTSEGCSAMSDANGNLLFYTDGRFVYDKTHNVMANGSGLLGDISSTQSALIIEDPGNASQYYIFTVPEEGNGNAYYSKVDITLAGGNGSVTVKNTFLQGSVTEKLTAVRHCNGHDFWVMTHELNSNKFFAYLVTNSGVSAAVISNAGQPHLDVHGQMKFSNNGARLACVRDSVINNGPPYQGISYIDVFSFDNNTGIVSNPKPVKLNSYQKSYGIEFSQDNSKLYAGFYDISGLNGDNSYLLQFDVNASDISSTGFIVSTIINDPGIIYRALQIGRDGKIYVVKSNTPYICVINSPNISGTGCNYADNALNIDPNSEGRINLLGLPGFMCSYFNPSYPATTPCIVQVSANYFSSDTVICQGDCIGFTDISTGSVTAWQWTFPNATPSVSAVKNPSPVCFPSPGTYSVRLIVSNSNSTDSVQKTIIVVPNTLSVSADVTITAGTSVTLTANGTPGSYTWTPSTALSSTNISYPVASPSVTTTYTVVGTGSNNCTTSSMVTVYVQTVEIPCGDIFIPTGFTPNNDGVNELICVMGSCINEFHLDIFDRWGEKVFETTDQSRCWDGKKDGKLMDTGVFVYHLTATLQNGDQINKKGNIHLIR